MHCDWLQFNQKPIETQKLKKEEIKLVTFIEEEVRSFEQFLLSLAKTTPFSLSLSCLKVIADTNYNNHFSVPGFIIIFLDQCWVSRPCGFWSSCSTEDKKVRSIGLTKNDERRRGRRGKRQCRRCNLFKNRNIVIPMTTVTITLTRWIGTWTLRRSSSDSLAWPGERVDCVMQCCASVVPLVNAYHHGHNRYSSYPRPLPRSRCPSC